MEEKLFFVFSLARSCLLVRVAVKVRARFDVNGRANVFLNNSATRVSVVCSTQYQIVSEV